MLVVPRFAGGRQLAIGAGRDAERMAIQLFAVAPAAAAVIKQHLYRIETGRVGIRQHDKIKRLVLQAGQRVRQLRDTRAAAHRRQGHRHPRRRAFAAGAALVVQP
ncbi:hypothetical protein D3C87_1667300 [compost metagenome]